MQPAENEGLIDLGPNVFPDERERLADLGFDIDWNGTQPVGEEIFLTYVIIDDLPVSAEGEEFLGLLPVISPEIRHFITTPGSSVSRLCIFFGFDSADLAAIFLLYARSLGQAMSFPIFTGLAASAYI